MLFLHTGGFKQIIATKNFLGGTNQFLRGDRADVLCLPYRALSQNHKWQVQIVGHLYITYVLHIVNFTILYYKQCVNMWIKTI
jgi:hypothetical protein